jgi:hypothetical protein
MKYIYHHLGLGDHIICNGLVRSLINPNEEYKMFVKSHNLDSVSFMYRDLNNLSFLIGDDNFVQNYINENNINKNELIIAGFYRHPNSKEFDDSFYLQNNLPFDYRWDKFFVNRDIESEKKLFDLYQVKENNYVFLHDDLDRNFEINKGKIINKDLPIISPKKGLSNNIFDYCYLMEKSCESHFIDSSFKLLFDSLQLRNSNLFYHINLKNNKIKDSVTKSQSKLNFTII